MVGVWKIFRTVVTPAPKVYPIRIVKSRSCQLVPNEFSLRIFLSIELRYISLSLTYNLVSEVFSLYCTADTRQTHNILSSNIMWAAELRYKWAHTLVSSDKSELRYQGSQPLRSWWNNILDILWSILSVQICCILCGYFGHVFLDNFATNCP